MADFLSINTALRPLHSFSIDQSNQLQEHAGLVARGGLYEVQTARRSPWQEKVLHACAGDSCFHFLVSPILRGHHIHCQRARLPEATFK